MKNLKHSSLLVNSDNMKNYFEQYFKEIFLAKNDQDVLKIYRQKHPAVLFLSCEKENGLDLAKEIRKFDRETVIALLTEKIDKEELLEALSLRLAGCLIKPFKSKKVENLLNTVDHELELKYQKMILLKNSCSFDIETRAFYDPSHNKIVLTRNETMLIEFLLKYKNRWVESNQIEYFIWGEDSLEQDCTGRLKTLLSGLRKKVPKYMIMNSYGIGYMITAMN